MNTDTRRARREVQRRELRRRRRLALALILGAAAAVVALILSASGSGGDGGAAARRAGGSTGQPAAASAHAEGSSGSSPSEVGASAPGAREPVPILMYHVIAAPPPGAPFPGLYVAPAEFAAQMHALKVAGWHAVTQDQVRAHWTRGAPLGPGKPIVLTFDNGYNSQYTQALPVLRGLGWVGVENIQLSGLPPSQGGLGEAQVRGLIAAGWELDTQGFSHADLVTLSAASLRHEVAVARTEIQRRFHVPVNWFCYPSGHYDARVIAEVRTAGYSGSTTVAPGWAHPDEDPYRLHRLRVLGGTSPQALLRQLEATRAEPQAPASFTGA